MTSPDTDLIRALLGETGPSFELLAEVDSTNRWLLDVPLAESPAPPRAVLAGRQHAGRGRRGRSWLAEPGRSVALSVAFERAGHLPPASGLSLAVGCALASALAEHCDGLSLKWPNDLLRHGRKCGGILIESRAGRASGDRPILRVVVGVGLNLFAPEDPRTLIAQPAAGLFDREPTLAIEALIAQATQAVATAWFEHERAGLEPFLDIWRRFDAWQGRQVELRDGDQVLEWGEALGIDEQGALRLRTAAGERRILAGDLSLRSSAQRRG